jgi:parallel beta-helix repeat protein
MRKFAPLSVVMSLATLFAFTGSAGAAVSCDLVASPSGSDSASGSVTAPFATAQHLVNALQPGQTGCLRAGTYNEDVSIGHGGNAGAPVTLTAYPGESVTIVGRFWIAQGANYVTVTGLGLDGKNADNLPSPTVNSNNDTFSYDDVTDEHTAICFDLGSDTYGVANNTLITHSRIHDCGVMPAINHDHGIYVADAVNTTIEWNLIYDNADRGIQLYPNAQYTTVDHNVIDSNGEGIIFSGDDGEASNNSNVYDNLLTNALIRHDAESWYPSGNPLGTNNSLHNNCVWGGAEGTIDTSGGGFTSSNNTTADPQYVDAANHDYHLQPTSPCLAITGDIAAAVDGTTPTTPTTTPATPTTTTTPTTPTTTPSTTTTTPTTTTKPPTTTTTTTPTTTPTTTTTTTTTTTPHTRYRRPRAHIALKRHGRRRHRRHRRRHLAPMRLSTNLSVVSL